MAKVHPSQSTDAENKKTYSCKAVDDDVRTVLSKSAQAIAAESNSQSAPHGEAVTASRKGNTTRV